MIELNYLQQFLTHKDSNVRDFVTQYYIEGNLGDANITNILIDLYEKGLNEEEQIEVLHNISQLPQDEKTLDRLYNLPIYKDDSCMHIWFHIDNAITHTKIELLNNTGLRPRIKENLQLVEKRLMFNSLSTNDLWNNLWEHSKNGEGKNLSDFNYGIGNIMIKELASREDFPYDQFEEMLNIDYGLSYKGWNDTYLCSLIGKLKYEKGISFLIKSLEYNGDYLNQEIMEALVSIASEEVIEKAKELYVKGAFKSEIINVLSNIKSSKSEETIIDFCKTENNIEHLTNMAYGLCKMFSKEGIPYVIDIIDKGYDKQIVNLEEAIYINHIVNNLSHSNMDIWKKAIEDEKERRKKSIDFSNILNSINNKNSNKTRTKKVGRNDPCPCGSGNKYKRCCGK